MAETFLAVQTDAAEPKPKLCVKRILPSHTHDQDFVQLFTDEARNGSLLQHENIVRVLDFGIADQIYFMVLEYVEGVSLSELLASSTDAQRLLEPELVSYIGLQLARALEYAHNAPNAAGKRGIVHRDISLSNVLLSKDGRVMLSDFGIAKAIGDKKRTVTGFVRGKATYMAPEYANTGHFDSRCDQFSLGIVMFRCLTGIYPFQGTSDPEIVHRASQGMHRSVQQLAPSAPPALTQIVERLIQPDPNHRFKTTSELVEALALVATLNDARMALSGLVNQCRTDSQWPAPTNLAMERQPAKVTDFLVRPSQQPPAISEPSVESPKSTTNEQPEIFSQPHQSQQYRSSQDIPITIPKSGRGFWLGTIALGLVLFAVVAGWLWTNFDKPQGEHPEVVDQPSLSDRPSEANQSASVSAQKVPPKASKELPKGMDIPEGIEINEIQAADRPQSHTRKLKRGTSKNRPAKGKVQKSKETGKLIVPEGWEF